MMLKFLAGLVCCLALTNATPSGYPQDPPTTRSTIFAEERMEGGIFENVEAFEDIQLYADETNPYRLPTTTKPSHYKVSWLINPIDRVYSGTVEISLYATQAGVSEITLHSTYHRINSLVLSKDEETVNSIYALVANYHFLKVRPSTNLEYNATNPVVYKLTITFEAPMRKDMAGIYESWYKVNATDVNSGVSWMATTQFQTTSARFAFPCYDEPSFKATFDITIRRPVNYKSWSCTKQRQTGVNVVSGYADDVYHTTPIMSTYLLALIVSQYDNKQTENGSFEVIARQQAMEENQGDYAYDVGIKLLAAMSDHTAIDFYSVNEYIKMTQAAIPDFSAGAMENWGLLTYREAYLLYDEGHTDSMYKQRIAYILSHEIAHMWFGNLVTCDWWDVTWLNEGFARYYQYFLTDWVETHMGFESRFVIEQVHSALLSDSANNPHPLTNPGVGSPGSISAMFSTLTYNKGAVLIRQTEHLLGTEVHTKGLRNYLRARSFKTAQPIDLFTELEMVGITEGALSEYGPEFSFIEYYKSWTEQSGIPVISVDVNHATGDMIISQRRFNINSGYSSTSTDYIVPISFATRSNPDFNNTKPTFILTDTVQVLNKGSVGDEWVIFNKQQTGYYRVNYDDYTWDLIGIALKSNERTLIHEYNRAQIVNDLFQFCRSGIMEYSRCFNLLSFLENETAYEPWAAAVTGFNWIRNRVATSTELTTKLNDEIIAKWASTVMSQLTYNVIPNELFMQSYLRMQLAPLMCNIGVRACRNAANQQFRALIDSGVEVAPDNRLWVYCNGLREGTASDFDVMWNRFRTHNVYTEKILLLQTLGCTPHRSSLYTFMTAIVTENFEIRSQDYTTAFNGAVTGNEGNTLIAWDFISDYLDLVSQAFGSPVTPLSYVSSRLRNTEQINTFLQWTDDNRNRLGNYYQSVRNGVSAAQQNIDWTAQVSSDFNDYFEGADDLTTSTAAPVTTVAPVTVTPDDLVEPSTPSLPDSAVTSVVSTLLFCVGIMAHLVY